MKPHRVYQVVREGQRFGRPGGDGAVVIDPEVRVGVTETKPGGYRYARMLCDCGTKYLAQISHLFRDRSIRCPECSRKAQHARRRRHHGLVSRTSSGYNVTVYVGHFKTRAEAEEVAMRARAVILPKVPPVAL